MHLAATTTAPTDRVDSLAGRRSRCEEVGHCTVHRAVLPSPTSLPPVPHDPSLFIIHHTPTSRQMTPDCTRYTGSLSFTGDMSVLIGRWMRGWKHHLSIPYCIYYFNISLSPSTTAKPRPNDVLTVTCYLLVFLHHTGRTQHAPCPHFTSIPRRRAAWPLSNSKCHGDILAGLCACSFHEPRRVPE